MIPLCSACLASLQVSHDQQHNDPPTVCYLCRDIKSALLPATLQHALAEFDGETFSLAITLPLASALYQALLRLYLAEHGCLSMPEVNVDFKHILLERLRPAIQEATGRSFLADSDLILHITLEDSESDAAIAALGQLSNVRFETTAYVRTSSGMKRQATSISRESLAGLVQCLGTDTLKSLPQYPPVHPATGASVSIEVRRQPVYVAGRYLKLARHVSQTPWIIDGQRKAELSVSECIGQPLLDACKGSAYNMVASGREDADVRMLGNGRPFYVEVSNPKRTKFSAVETAALQDAVNARHPQQVQVRSLTIIDRDATKLIKEGEESKTKTYCALVWLSVTPTEQLLAALVDHHDLAIQQKTPLRVLHRRAPLERPKIIHGMSAEVLDAERQLIVLRLSTEAGTYIKEFVHGDMGRTQPNLGSLLGCSADLLELDVTEVDLAWPPEQID